MGKQSTLSCFISQAAEPHLGQEVAPAGVAVLQFHREPRVRWDAPGCASALPSRRQCPVRRPTTPT
ncbi:hypothetical protein MES4922_120029 [Mesorhizobium ventifaucium]|uniref:Uncharacterized protein n=1 Tax=Mesorhizobium ventifaucium TaxID=666020 RepID=A0ABN8JAX2_9HYPH|nr:hypothetical protein MES4922_120029 [Mesorhizobium ventifaucium]